jgi:hypothetical protein
MSFNYTLRYKTFDQLMDEISMDFQNYDLENYIAPHQLIKVAKRVNYDLGLRIMMTKESILEVEKGRVKLPDDFFVLNFALICDSQTVEVVMPQGTNIQEVAAYKETNATVNPCTDGPVNCRVCQPNACSCSCATQTPAACTASPYNPLVPYGDSCIKPRVYMNCKGDSYELIQIVKTQTYSYKRLLPLRILQNAQDIDCDCPNLYLNNDNQAWIKNGYLYTTFSTGKVYINFQGMMEDSDGNLLVPDHDLLNDYYEYALKSRILENLIMNDELQAANKLQLIESRLKVARNQALSFVNTPNFAEMKAVVQMNRKAMNARYYDMFRSYPWYIQDGNPNKMFGYNASRII